MSNILSMDEKALFGVKILIRNANRQKLHHLVATSVFFISFECNLLKILQRRLTVRRKAVLCTKSHLFSDKENHGC